MNLRRCDSCARTIGLKGGEIFFAVRLSITKGTTWGPAQVQAAERMAGEARRFGMKALVDALDAGEPADIVGDTAPVLCHHADVRICAECITTGALGVGVDVIDLIRASEGTGERSQDVDHDPGVFNRSPES